jgi:hypothetical protein
MESDDKITGFPAIIPRDHPLGKYSDAAFHAACWDKCPDKEWMEEIHYLWNLIYNSRPKNLKTIEEIDAWTKEAFQDWPPKGRVVIFEQLYPGENDDEPNFFYSDKEAWDEFEKAEKEAEDRMQELRRYHDELERRKLRFVRDDD